MDKELIETSADGVATLTLNRPDRLNALSTQITDDLLEALPRLAADAAVGAIVLTGAGRAFCAGGDVKRMAAETAPRSSEEDVARLRSRMEVSRLLHEIPKPTIAMVNGPAVAGGLALALACDLRIAAASAKLGDTSGKFGLLPDEGGAWLFPRAMGLDRALKMTLLGEVYDAETAQRLGLVTETVPDAELAARTLALATALAARAPLAVRLAKSMLRRAQDLTLEQSLGDAQLSVMISNPSQDVREGVKAFFEKREPKFEGR